MKIRYLGGTNPKVRGPGGVLFDGPGSEANVPDYWGKMMVETAEFEAVSAPKKTAATKKGSD